MTKKIQNKVIMQVRIVLLILAAAVWMPGMQAQTAPNQSAPGQAPGQGQGPGTGQSYGQPGQAPGQAYGQKPAQTAPQGNGHVKGTIRDSTTNGGIEYATVGLYRQGDSTLVNGIVTNPSGEFVLKGIPNGQFYLDVNFIGYVKKRIHNITITPQSAHGGYGSYLTSSQHNAD